MLTKLVCVFSCVFIFLTQGSVGSSIYVSDNRKCESNQFKCKSGKCILKTWVCDADYDCDDKSDEENCSVPSTEVCRPTEFKCHNGNRCINKNYQCDGEPDCLDGSDEICPDPSFRCDYTYYGNISGYLKFHDVPGTWHEARRRCSYEGTSFTIPGDRVAANLFSSITEAHHKKEIFIAISSLASGGNYYFGASPNFWLQLPWAEGEPNNAKGKEYCIVMRTNGTIADERCDDSRSFLCYISKDHVGTVNECGTIDNEYKLHPETNRCYKFHSDPKSWRNANHVCLAEGGTLTIINNLNEMNLLKRIYATNSRSTGHTMEPDSQDVAFIGFSYDNDTERYETINRDNLTVAGYDQFYPGYNDCPLPEFLCGGFHKEGYLDLAECSQRLVFICEKDPKYDTCSTSS